MLQHLHNIYPNYTRPETRLSPVENPTGPAIRTLTAGFYQQFHQLQGSRAIWQERGRIGTGPFLLCHVSNGCLQSMRSAEFSFRGLLAEKIIRD